MTKVVSRLGFSPKQKGLTGMLHPSRNFLVPQKLQRAHGHENLLIGGGLSKAGKKKKVNQAQLVQARRAAQQQMYESGASLMEFGSMSMKRLKRARRHLIDKERMARIAEDSPRQKYKKQARRERLGPVQSEKGYNRYVDVSDIKRRTAQKAGGVHPMEATRRMEERAAKARAYAKQVGATGGGSGAGLTPREAAERVALIKKEDELIRKRMFGKKSFRGHRQ